MDTWLGGPWFVRLPYIERKYKYIFNVCLVPHQLKKNSCVFIVFST